MNELIVPKCLVCNCEILEGDSIHCPRCDTPHHKDCWEYMGGGCARFGCVTRFHRRNLLGVPHIEFNPPISIDGFCEAVQYASVEQVRDMLKRIAQTKEVDLDSADSVGNTPLYIAASHAQFEKVELLLNHYVNPCKKNVCGMTPLDIARYMLKMSMQNRKNGNYNTLCLESELHLMLAREARLKEIIARLKSAERQWESRNWRKFYEKAQISKWTGELDMTNFLYIGSFGVMMLLLFLFGFLIKYPRLEWAILFSYFGFLASIPLVHIYQCIQAKYLMHEYNLPEVKRLSGKEIDDKDLLKALTVTSDTLPGKAVSVVDLWKDWFRQF